MDKKEMRPLSGIPFRKMHGLGNDFVVIDARTHAYPLSAKEFERIADRRFGIGCDQLILLESANDADATMRIFNPDGGEVGACGNATRCIGALLAAEKGADRATIRTRAGLLRAEITGDLVAVDMGLPGLAWSEIPLVGPSGDTARVALDVTSIDPALPGWFSAVSMGNPHAIFFVTEVMALDLPTLGPRLETHPIFPEKANISLAEQIAPNHFRVRVWERAAGITLACGTAACAVAVAAARLGLANGDIRITLPGGDLVIGRTPAGRVIMRGPVASSFSGLIDPSLLAA